MIGNSPNLRTRRGRTTWNCRIGREIANATVKPQKKTEATNWTALNKMVGALSRYLGFTAFSTSHFPLLVRVRLEIYPFAALNVQMDIPTYTHEEYERFLRFDPTWSKNETDYLFSLCRFYDCRWPVVWDNYDYGTKRSIEELMDRYFGCCRRLFEGRMGKGEDVEGYRRRLEAGGWDFDKSG